MSTVVQCPRCHADIDITPDLADQPIRCACGHTFAPHAAAIRAGAPRRKADDYDEPAPSPRRPTARAAFPWGPIAIVTIGILFLLLAFSVGFNVWILMMPDNRRFGFLEARDAELMALEQRARAEEARELALRAEREAQANLRNMEQALAEARKRLDDANFELANNPDRAAPEWGSLDGRVVWKGELPNVESLENMINRHPDKDVVNKAPKELLLDSKWRIDPKSKGVANVCVFIKRPKDGVLPIAAEDKVRKDAVILDAPFLVFEPHMLAVYPEWNDGKVKGKTGQQLRLKNSSPTVFCARGVGNPESNPGFSLAIPKGAEIPVVINPQAMPIPVTCNIHVWMSAYIWCFDHPYFAITKADGTFTIPLVPAGMDVQVMAWHESQGWLFTKNGKTMNLKAGKNALDFEMSAK
jgi:hypothetical protein